MSNKSVGGRGEEIACKYLQGLGYRILARNYQIRGGEIDIIALDGREIVFVEVKTRYSHKFGSPLEAITPWKIKTLLKAAQFYLVKIRWGDKPYRIDAVTIAYSCSRQNPDIDYLKSITC